MASITLTINKKRHTVDVDPDMPLLWVIRDVIGYTGTKFGCGRALCGSCTVLIDGEATRSCVTPVDLAAGRTIITIEGLSPDRTHPVQIAWMEEDVPQCGYCQPGMIMAVAALLDRSPNPSENDIEATMAMHLCRCGTYNRIRRAIITAAKTPQPGSGSKGGVR
jgi:aerobic-type carbon monoxide dehydrogenase small subunit (CoxS/CutS family)